MAYSYCLQKLWQLSLSLFVGLLVLLDMVRMSYGYPTYFKPSKWNHAHATYYGDDTASATMGKYL